MVYTLYFFSYIQKKKKRFTKRMGVGWESLQQTDDGRYHFVVGKLQGLHLNVLLFVTFSALLS